MTDLAVSVGRQETIGNIREWHPILVSRSLRLETKRPVDLRADQNAYVLIRSKTAFFACVFVSGGVEMGVRTQKRCRGLICARLVQVFLAAITQAAVAAPSGASDYRMDWYVISAGNSAEVVSERFRLRSTLGQPVVGFSTSSGYALDTGFWFGIGDPTCSDCIFVNSFESTGGP